MGEMQSTLEQLLASVGTISHKRLPFPRDHDVVRAGHGELVNDVYKNLGGGLPSASLNLRPWDMEFDGVAVELDEYLHFNRYRAFTLDSMAYSDLPSFPLEAYRKYCVEFESNCLDAGGYGGKWSNSGCERQFGPASAPRVLDGNGAPRWKQRAFYDFVKDLSPLLIDVKVARVAIWDRISDGGAPRVVRDILSRPTTTSARALADFVQERAV